MSKKETLFPLKTLGGKIQNIRYKHGFTGKTGRQDFYDAILPEEKGIKSETKTKNVSNWESGKCQPPMNALLSICKKYHVSLDYLFGIIGMKNHTIEYISYYTGLNEASIEYLHGQHNHYFVPDNYMSALRLSDYDFGEIKEDFNDEYISYLKDNPDILSILNTIISGYGNIGIRLLEAIDMYCNDTYHSISANKSYDKYCKEHIYTTYSKEQYYHEVPGYNLDLQDVIHTTMPSGYMKETNVGELLKQMNENRIHDLLNELKSKCEATNKRKIIYELLSEENE